MKSSFITTKIRFSRGQQTNIFTLQHIDSTGRLSENLLMLPKSVFSPSGGNTTATQHGAWLQTLPVRDCILRWDHYYMSFPLNPSLLHLLMSLEILPSISIYCLSCIPVRYIRLWPESVKHSHACIVLLELGNWHFYRMFSLEYILGNNN